MKAMILAAGVGSRLDPLTNQIPKPLVPVGNRPVMEHIVCLLRAHGVTEIVSNLHHLPEQLVDFFGDGSRLGVKLTFHHEKELTGDAGGVRACRDFLENDTFLVVMGDLLTDADLTHIIYEHKKKGALATIAIKEVEDVSQFGVVIKDKQGFITGFQEKPAPEEALSNLASTGIYVLEPEVFKYIPSNGTFGFGRQLFPLLLEKRLPVLAVQFKDYWSDVGTIKQYRLSNFDVLEGKVKVQCPGEKTKEGWLGTNCYIGNRCQINGLFLMGNNSRLLEGVRISGRVIIGDNCVVEENAQITDSIIWSSSHIEANAVVSDSVIGSNCIVKNGSKYEEMAFTAQRPSPKFERAGQPW